MRPISRLVDRYARDKDAAPRTIEQYRFALRTFERWLKRPATLRDFTDDKLNRWIVWALENYARPTLRSQRGALLTLWRYAAELRLINRLPVRVRKVRVDPAIPQAWYPADMRALLAAARQAPGAFRDGTPRADALVAWMLVGYYSGLRPCDTMAFRRQDVGREGVCVARQSKTRTPIVFSLPPDAMAAVRRIVQAGRDRVFPMTRKAAYYWWLWLKDQAQVSGSPKWLRRTGATQVEIQQPGSAMAFLGHKTPGLAYRHYVDARQVQARKPTPPRID